ncbi:MAG: tripartite tricarboxylate transporter TctB family protein [Betaproteobacteria bacterium]|nr:tripartite tricarboxylate transporter TctB family protein [Betaproteobacteria bacterium]
MKIDLRDNKDFLSGLMFIVTGVVAMVIARDYPFGSALRMGPGYFPSVLGGILVAFGVYVMLMGLRKQEKVMGNWSVRALILLPLSMFVYGFLIEHVGFIGALLALTFVSAAAGREFKLIEVLLVTIGLTVFSVGLFIYGLGLPYPLVKGVWGL